MAVDGNLVFNTKIDMSGFDKGTKNLSKDISELKTKFDDVSTAQNKTQKATDQSREALNKMGSTLSSTESDLSRAENAINKVNDKFDDSQREAKESGSAYDSLKKSINDQENALERVGKEYGDVSTKENKNASETRELKGEYNTLQRELNQSEKELNDVEREFQQTGKAADDSGEKISKFSKIGGALKGVGVATVTSLAAVGTATVAAGKKLTSMANDTAAAGDTIDKSSQKLGLSAEAYQEWDYVLSQSGVDIESAGQGFKTLTNQIDAAKKGSKDAQERFAKLGISMDDINKLSREELFTKAITGMQGLADNTDRAALANQLFGRSGQQLAPLFNATAESTEALKQKAHELGFVMSDESVKAAVDYTDSMDTLKRTFEGVKNNIVSQLLPGFTSITTGLSELLAGQDGAKEKLQQGTQEIVDSLKKIAPRIVDVLLTVVGAAAEIAPTIITSLVQGISSNLGKIISAAGNIVKTFILSLVRALPEIGKSVLSIFPSLLDGLKQVFFNIVRALPSLFKIVSESLPSLIPQVISAVIDMAVYLMKHIGDILQPIIDNLPKIIISIVDALVENVPKLIEGAIQMVLGIVENIPKIIKGIIEALPEIIEKVITGLIECIPQLIEGIIELVLELIIALPDIIVGILEAIPDIMGAIGEAFVKAGPKMIAAFERIFNKLKAKLEEKFPGIGEWFAGIWENITGFFEGIGEWFRGLWENITSVFSGIGEWFAGIWNTITESWHMVFDPWVEIFKRAADWVNTNVIEPVTGFFQGLWEKVSGFFTSLWDDISSVWSTVSDWFNTNVIEPISDFFGGIWEKVSDGASQAWEGVKKAFSPVIDWFKNTFHEAWTKVKDVFSKGGEIFTGIKEGLFNGFKVVVNGLIDGINYIISQTFWGLNNALENIHNVEILGVKPFEWVNTIDVPEIPKLAKGGVVEGGTPFIAGEAGAEAVIPLENNNQWIYKFAHAFADGLSSFYDGDNFTQTPNKGAGDKVVNINLYLDNVNVKNDDDIEDVANKVSERIAEKLVTEGMAVG